MPSDKKKKNILKPKKVNLYEFYINNSMKNKEQYGFKDNCVDTKKYNIITFLPKALLIQFVRVANIYFLVCAVLQCIPAISPLGAETALVPIVIVLSVSIVREGIEDCARAKLDKQQNSEPTEVYVEEQWEQTQSGKLHMGEIVSVKQDDAFPADLILIDSELPEGICYIETGTLDGEKTLKLKESPPQTAGKFNKNGEKHASFLITGSAIADQPNPELYMLNGRMHLIFSNMNNKGIQETHDIPLDAKQLLLKGAKLRNTSWIIGIVVYTGHNCKIMKNSKDPVTKYSSVELLMNKALIFIFILQAILCIISACLRGYYYKKNNLKQVDGGEGEDNNEIDKSFGYTQRNYVWESFFNYFTYLLLLNTMIPISLIITLEIVKLIQGAFMKADAYSYSKVRKKWLNPNTISLNEECGLVNYIFSDKTGTLTCNRMQFKYCVIGDICYEYLRTEGEGSVKEMNFRYDENIVIVRKYEMFENILDENKMRNASKYNNYILKSKDNSVKLSLENTQDLIDHFWYALSLCHSCSIQQNDDGTEEYICMSPDSIELVKTARDQGWNFIESGSSSIKRIRLGKDGLFRNDIERLQLIEFSSDRKRETVIVRDRGIIKVYVKGADSIVEQRLSKKTPDSILRQCKYYVNKFSAQGFRTLFIAMKILSQSEYDDYAAKLKEALMSEEDKDQKVEAVNNTIETDLFLIGTTIVEDKLQDNVPETIRNLRLSNIKVWMLTGDKMNTAYNIGLSCNLINKEMKTFSICGIEVKKNEDLEVINKDERDQVIIDFAKEFEKFKNQFDSMEKPQFGILVDEKALLTINEDTLIQNIFLGIAKDAVAVICCRVSPLQKSQVVKMMKNYDPNAITLAIGDGGNDVSMIMEAHIGVGIYGEEGMRAVQSSDYAIGEFQCLSPLLFFHGRTNYIRNSECIQYFFYKNFVFTILQFVFGFYCNFTGQTIVDDWFITTFNLIFTSMPLGSRALMDHDLKPDDGEVVNKMLPFMYAENRDNPIFTIKNFLLNLLKGIIHCSINFYIVIYSFMGENFDIKGNLPELWVISVTLFTNVLLIVTTDLLIYTKYHTWINFAIMSVVTVLAYIAFIFAVHHMTLFNSVGTMMNTFSSYKIWIMFIFVCGTCALIDFTILAFNYSFNRTITTLLQLQFNSIGKLNDEEEVPDEIKEKLKLYNQYEDNKTEDDDDKKGNKDRDVSKSRTDFSNNNLLRSRDPSFFRKSNLKDVEKSSGSDRSSFRLDNNTDRERRLTSGSESSEKKNKNSSSVSNSSSSSNTDKSRNKKNKLKGKKNIKNNNKIKKKNKSESNSNSNSNSKSNSKNNSSSSKFNSSKSSSDKNKKGNESDSESYNDIDSDIEKDVPKKTMEYMSKKKLDTNNGIKKKNNRKSAQRNDNDDDDIGENYSEEFSENVSRDEKYFFPKQTQPTRSYYFSDEKNHVINRFPK